MSPWIDADELAALREDAQAWRDEYHEPTEAEIAARIASFREAVSSGRWGTTRQTGGREKWRAALERFQTERVRQTARGSSL